MTAQLTEIEEARQIVLDCVAPLPDEPVELGAALGRALAEEARSSEPVPGFDNSAMDGYAVRAADVRGATADAPASLQVAGESRAGHPAEASARDGEAVAISTGAMVPGGADSVVRVEDTQRDGERVLVEAEVEPGQNVRRAGEDIAAGEVVMRPGTPIGPAELGVLASLGLPQISCYRRPRLHLLTSGDELLGPGEAMTPGGVRDSNAYAVSALAEGAGAELLGIGSAADDAEQTRAAIEPALEADVVVLCGGVSVGAHDHVKGALAELGVEQRFWGVALRPGKPTWFGTRGRTLVFGLPGNPVSAMVTFVLFVRPALAALSGTSPERHRTVATLADDYEKRPGRAHAVRCGLELGEDGWHARPAPSQGSHVLTSMLGADCLAMIPAESGSLAAGEKVEIELLERGGI